MKRLLRKDLGTEQVRAWAAQQLAAWLARNRRRATDNGELGVAECLPLFQVEVGKLQQSRARNVLKHVTWDGRWHVQIRDAEKVIGCARVRETAAGLTVCSVNRGLLAGKLDGALAQADEVALSDTHVVVLLEAAPLRVLTLLFVPRGAGNDYWAWPLRLPDGLARAHLFKMVPIDNLIRELAPLRSFGMVTD